MAAARGKGVASLAWGKYDPNPVPKDWKPKRKIVYVPAAAPTPYDPMCDYIEDAEWWLARSDVSARALQKAFEQQEVACLLYEQTGAIIEMGRVGNQWLLAIQIARVGKSSWDLDISLSDAGVYLEELYEEKETDGIGSSEAES